MAPTSDERREVAEALRGDPDDTLIPQVRDGFEVMTFHEAAYRFWDMCRRVESAADIDIARSTTSVLADLIDPTCHNADDGVRGGFVCSECSYHVEQDTMDADFNAWEDMRHCPHCGARITGRGER